MRTSHANFLFLLTSGLTCLALGACQDVPDESAHDEPVVAAPDAGTAPGTPSTSEPEPEPAATLTLPSPTSLPLGPSDVLRLSDTHDLDTLSAWFLASDGSLTGYFDTSDVTVSRSAYPPLLFT